MLGILFAASALAAPRLVLAGEVAVGVPLAVRLTEDLGGNVLVAGCGAVELERREGEVWVPVAGPMCDRAVPAVVVDRELALSVVLPGPGTWRAVVAMGSGCVEGRPLAIAACRRLEAVRSAPFEADAPSAVK